MKVFKIHQGYRRLGLGYGLPVFYVDLGFAITLTPEGVMEKLGEIGLATERWVVIRNNPLKEKGVGVLVSGLKFSKIKVELEVDGNDTTPGWFPDVDRWIVNWRPDGKFNYKALRPRQDILMGSQQDLRLFLSETRDLLALKAVVVDEPKEVWDLVKKYDVRVYEKERK